MTNMEPVPAYQQAAAAVITTLGSDATNGLTAEDARSRLAQYGPNELQA